MNEEQSALAYGRAYALFSEVYRQGLREASARILGVDYDNSQDGASHYQLFVHNVFPYESIFLGNDGLLGGVVTERVVTFYERIGFQADSSDSADHISNELSALAHLCFAEHDAIVNDLVHEVQRLRQLQRRFLDEHLLRWLATFWLAVQQQEQSVYTAIVQQSFELVCRHREALGDDLMAQDKLFILPRSPDVIDDEKTSLRDIARYLLTPAYTGFYLSSDDIKRIGTRLRLPHGFGKRQQILTNLLRTASDYELFPETIAVFKASALDWHTQLESLAGLPVAIQQVWLARLDETLAVLNHIEQMARHAMDDPYNENTR
ncbi:MAG: molecular chaperone TorD family protein [Chloroflexota bacterium]